MRLTWSAATLADLSNYSATPKDAVVVSWPISHTRPNTAQKKRDIEFTVKAQVLKLKEGASEAVEESPRVINEKEAEPSQPVKDEL